MQLCKGEEALHFSYEAITNKIPMIRKSTRKSKDSKVMENPSFIFPHIFYQVDEPLF